MAKQKTVICGKCGTENSSNEKKCSECGEYLHQFKTGDLPSQANVKKKTGCLGWIGLAFIIIFVISIISVIANPSKTNRPAVNANQKQGNKPVEPKIQLLNLTASQLLKDYQANKVAADQKYKDKDAKITGIVTSIGTDIMDTLYITLGTGDQFEMVVVQCFFAKSYQSVLSKVEKGKRMTVTGHIDSYTMNILVRDCSF
jgi:hypothetical protein